MPNQYKDVYVQCPFYKRQTSVGISCEGLTDDMVISLHFSTSENKKKQMQCFCENRYNNCEIYRIVEKKYD